MEEKTYTFTVHDTGLIQKPEQSNMVTITTTMKNGTPKITQLTAPQYYGINSVRRYRNMVLTLPQLFNLIIKGHTFKVGTYDLSRKTMGKEGVDYVQLLALDFDEIEFSPQELLDEAQALGLTPNFWYYTFSQGIKKNNNLRVLWVLDEPLDPHEYEVVVEVFMGQFKSVGIDVSTKDSSRLFFGTNKGGTFIHDKPLQLGSIGFLNAIKKVEKGQAYNKAIKTKKDYANKVANLPPCEKTIVGKGWHNELYYVCSSWRKWMDGEYLEYSKRFVLWANLKYLAYNSKKESIIGDIWSFYNPEAYEGHMSAGKDEIYSVWKSVAWAAPICDGGLRVSEFFSKATYESVSTKRPLNQVQTEVEDALPIILQDPGMHYVKVQTGMGKTEIYIRETAEMNLDKKKIVVAVPHYNLISEVYERYLSKYPNIKDKIYVPEHSGDFTAQELFNLKHGRPSGKTTSEQRKNVLRDLIGKNYFTAEELEDPFLDKPETYKKTGIYIISHAVLVNTPTLHHVDLLIVDENIEDALEYNTTIGIEEIARIKAGLTEDKQPLIDKFIGSILSSSKSDRISNEPIKDALTNPPNPSGKGKSLNPHWSYSEFRNQMIRHQKSGCPGLYNMIDDTYELVKTGEDEITIYGVSSILDNLLDSGATIVLLTATTKPAKLNDLFPAGNYVEYEFDLAANHGYINQYFGVGITGAMGNGTQYAAKYMAVLDKLLKDKGINPKDVYVLTHKSASDLWKPLWNIETSKNMNGKETNIHISNCSGLDRYKGKTVAIVGKLEMPQIVYEREWYIHRPGKPLPRRVNKIQEINGVNVSMWLFDDEWLQARQLEDLNLTLSQAAGRARALRESGAKVIVIANYPLEERDMATRLPKDYVTQSEVEEWEMKISIAQN